MRSLILLVLSLAVLSPRAQLAAGTLTWPELSKMPLPAPGKRIAYGDKKEQFGELRVPKGNGPFPVIVVIHGGCWQNAFDYVYMTRLSVWFVEHGIATWTIEYRRLGDDGGGWPGTFLDVADATDSLRKIAGESKLDLDRVYAAGHSAGGQLALWLAGRSKLRETSGLYRKDPIAIRGVLGLAAITNLANYRIGPPDSCHSSVEPLLGGTPDKVASRYAEASPSEQLPLGVREIFIQGEADPIVAAGSVQDYVRAAKKSGDDATIFMIPGAGHFEACVPLPETKSVFEEALRLLLAPAA